MADLKTNSFLKALRKCIREDEYYSERRENILAERAEEARSNGQQAESTAV